ncbi:hypothetical protein JCM8547_006741 [Rhodosporidiobolus lusitaniae]
MASLRSVLPAARRALVSPSPRLLPLLAPSSSLWRPLPRSFSSFPALREQSLPQHTLNGPRTPIGQLDRRLQITFTCTAPVPLEEGSDDAKACGHRSTHEFSKRSYDKGVVIVQCPECENRHLIADHLHWFSSTPSPANPTGQTFGAEQPRTIESILREKGEQVRWEVRETKERDGGVTFEIGAKEGGEEDDTEVKRLQ